MRMQQLEKYWKMAENRLCRMIPMGKRMSEESADTQAQIQIQTMISITRDIIRDPAVVREVIVGIEAGAGADLGAEGEIVEGAALMRDTGALAL